jgi:hypothetical protein
LKKIAELVQSLAKAFDTSAGTIFNIIHDNPGLVKKSARFFFFHKSVYWFLIYNTDHPLAEDRNGGLFTGATPPLATRIGFNPLILKQDNSKQHIHYQIRK